MNIKELFSERSGFLVDLELTNISNINTRKDLSNFFKENIILKEKSGVYFFEYENSVVYIGSSGKIKQDINFLPFNTNNGIGSRLLRSNIPYSFIGDYLCYQRNPKNGNKKDVRLYRQKINLSSIKIGFTLLDPLISPTYIEHFFLQKFLDQTKRIPLINNQI